MKTAKAIKRLGQEVLGSCELSEQQESAARFAVQNPDYLAARPKQYAEAEMVLRYALLHNRAKCSDCDYPLDRNGDCERCQNEYGEDVG